MSNQPPFNLSVAHRYFASECFNNAWELMDQPERTAAEDEQMLLRAFASFYHWTQDPECSPSNRSVSLWQLSRVYALLAQPESAYRYGRQCYIESQSANLSAFYVGYACEALARAAMLAGNQPEVAENLEKAHQLAKQIEDAEARQMLLDDLKSIK